MKARLLKCAILTLAVLTGGCCIFVVHAKMKWRGNVEVVSGMAQQCYTGHQRYETWHAKIAFPYESSAPQRTWTQRVRKLHNGQSVVDVLRVFGEPDYVQALVSKKGDRFFGCSWRYEVRNPEDTVNYKRGSWVEIFFDKSDGHVVDFDGVNIEGIPNRPLPGGN